jgi:tRNA threonylcarbamoyladenosine biosynthesis protein TsaB
MNNSAIISKKLSLALETTGRIGSVAIGLDEKLSDEKTFSAPLRHNAELFDTIGSLLKQISTTADQINEIYISIGPGSFTGIRISVTVAKMMALANKSKIVAVNTSDAIALNVYPVPISLCQKQNEISLEDFNKNELNNTIKLKNRCGIEDESIKKIATIIDAKRGQFFVAVFERKNNSWEKILPDCMITAEEFKQKFDNEPIWLLGEGLLYYSKNFETDNIKILSNNYWSPKASNVFKLGSQLAAQGKFADPVSLVPLYIRRPEAEENLEKQK